MNTTHVSALADEVRAEARRWADLSWQLDSALSLHRKAQPSTGYRSTEGLGDAPWSLAEANARLAGAVFTVARALRRRDGLEGHAND